MNKPIISVVLPVYNEEKFIGECIESILNQTYRDFELIIINDASTDGSVGIINNFLDPRIVLIHNNNNLGIAKSLNRGFEKAKGEFIARIDANDIAVETRFEKQIEYLINHPQCAVVCCPVFKIDKSGNIIEGLSGKYIPQEFIQTWMFYYNCFYHSAAIMRKTSLPNPPYDESSFAEDYTLWVDLSRKWELHIIDEDGDADVIRINKDGSITNIATIDKDGEREDTPKEDQVTVQKIK